MRRTATVSSAPRRSMMPTLADAGIDKKEANTARKLAAMSSISVQVIAIEGW